MKAVPSARNARIAPDSGRYEPSSTCRTGVERAGFMAANSSVSVSPLKMSIGTRS